MSGARKPGFSFYLSCDINLQVRLRISDVQGALPSFRKCFDEVAAVRPTAVHVVAQITVAEEPFGLDARTTYGESSTTGCMWNEWLTFCVKYRDLPHDAQLALNVWEYSEGEAITLVGGTCMPLFNKKGRLKTGPQRLKLWEGREACVAWPSTTPGKVPLSERGRLGQLEHLVKLYNRGDIPAVGWLDNLTMEEIQRLQQIESKAAAGRQELQLLIDLPLFPFAVLYQQPMSYTAAVQMGAGGGTSSTSNGGLSPTQSGDAGAAAAAAANGVHDLMLGGMGSWSSGKGTAVGAPTSQPVERHSMDNMIVLLDPEVGRENPAELKAQKLSRGLTRGLIDRDLKPNSDERRRITTILKLPPNKALHADEKALIWRFRYSLIQERRALTKFLKCVDWSDVLEAKQAAELMGQWALIDMADALELLSPDFKNEEVRAHAVSVLQQKDDDELMCYLLQLVQALRYEASNISRLARFLIGRGIKNPYFAVMLHWYLFTEWEDPVFGARASSIHQMLVATLQKAPSGERVWEAIRRQTDMVSQLGYIARDLKASKFKAARATQKLQEMVSESGACGELTTMRVPLPLDPNILLDGIVPSECFCFKSAMLPLRLCFRVDPLPVNWRVSPKQQLAHHNKDSPMPFAAGPLAASGAPDNRGVAGQRSNLGGSGHSEGRGDGKLREGPSSHHGPHGPHGPHGHGHLNAQQVLQVLLPSRTGLVVKDDVVKCVMIYKKGDDLRQDQFTLQMISLMDRLLKRENLDLRMTPYKVLPTSSDDGLVEFVPSTPLSKVLQEHRTIHKYLLLAPGQADPTGPFGMKAEVLETFIRSCAGYCVATYILGVGDRHLDNLMLTTDGRLFHIDFGYILGNDPKPFPPPMKICKEMVEAMGGQGSNYYVQFRMYACEAYNILRKSSDLILSLFHLMAGSSIEAIRQDPEKAILRLQEKLRLDINDEGAVEWMQQLINESATALMPQIVETTHRWAQYWR